MLTKKNIAKLSIIIPTINSSDFILITLQTLINEIETYTSQYEIIVVDDNSKDSTLTTISKFISEKQSSNIILIKNQQKYGQAISTINGIQMSSGTYIITFDDDLQYNVKEIRKLYDYLSENNQYDMVNGNSIEKQEKHLFYKFSKHISTLIIYLLFPSIYNKKYFTSFKIFRRSIIFNKNDKFKTNIYFFWNLPFNRITFQNINKYKSIRPKSNYNKWIIINTFYFLILKAFQRIFLLIIIFSSIFVLLFTKGNFIFINLKNSTIIFIILYIIFTTLLNRINFKMTNSIYKIIS